MNEQIKKIEPTQLSHSSPVTKSCDIDARFLNKVESIAYDIASNYEALELAPLCPTIGMALESASRRKNPADRKTTTRLCTSQRVLRLPLPANPAFTAHFKLFSLVNAGRDTGSFDFESSALKEQISFYLDFLHALIDRQEIRATVRALDSSTSQRILSKHSVSWPKEIREPSIDLLPFDLPEHLIRQLEILNQSVRAPLSSLHTNVGFSFNLHRLTGLGYYQGPCFHIKLLLSDTKERLMTSAIGTEILCRMFRQKHSN